MPMPDPVHVVIIGRPNVGKSTLFNRLTGTRRALVHARPGTTRDRNFAPVIWKDRAFTLVDTAGWAEDDSIFSAPVRQQLEIALAEAAVVLFVVDAKQGIHPYDAEVSSLLRASRKDVVLVVNKIDTAAEENAAAEFYRLGTPAMITVSATHGRNIHELLDIITAKLPAAAADVSVEVPAIRIILVGKPNVGKSSLVNTLAHQERSIVHDAPGTTREALDITIERDGKKFMLIDTPGMHRRKKITDDMEYLAVLSANHALERADVAVLVMDLQQDIGEAEARIAEMILNNGCACLLVVNKWDLVENREQVVKQVQKELDRKLSFLWWSKLLLVSAKTGQRAERILSDVEEIYGEYSRRVGQEALDEAIRYAEHRKPLSRHGKVLHIRSIEQTGIRPPSFTFLVNDPELVHFSYQRFLENILRERFGFTGTPLLLKFRRENERKRKRRS